MASQDLTSDTLAQTERELALSASALQSVLECTTVTPEARSKISTALANMLSAQSRLARRSGPFATLPFDVLAEIFRIWAASYVVPKPQEDDQEFPAPGDRILPPAFAAAAVCRHWRAAALSCAPLWSRLTLNMRRCATDLVQYLDLMLPRTCSRPLDIMLDYASHWTTDADGRKSDMLARLLMRCRTLHVHWHMNVGGPRLELHFADSVLPLLMAPLPHLEEVKFEGIIMMTHITGCARILTTCPKLRVLSMRCIPWDFIDAASITNLESFKTHLTLAGTELRDMATNWPRLRTLIVPSVIEPVQLQFLQLRRLRNLDASILACFRSSQDVPLLQTLEVCNSVQGFEAFAVFVKKAPGLTSLETLVLVEADWSMPQTNPVHHFLHLFHGLANVRTLRLEEFSARSMREFYDFWDHEPHLAGSIETLQHVECAFCIGATVGLVNFLQRRNQSASTEVATWRRIQEVSIRQEGEMELDRCIFPAWMRTRLEQVVDRVCIDTSLVTRPRGCVRNYDLYSPAFP